MENLTPLQKLDKVLDYLKDPSIPLKNDSTLITFLNLKGYKYSHNDIIRVTQKLIDDNYVFTDDDENYHFTFEGYYFVGYESQYKNDRALALRHNIRDFVLSWGTALAGIAATALLIWQIYSYNHPPTSPCDTTAINKTSQKRP